MTDRLVEEHTSRAGRHDHRHLPRRRGDRIEHPDRPFGCGPADLRRRMQADVLRSLQPCRSEEPRLDDVVTGGHHLHDQPDARTLLVHPPAVTGRDQDALQRVPIGGGDLPHAAVERSRRVVGLVEPGDLARLLDRVGRFQGRVDHGGLTHRQGNDLGPRFLLGNRRRRGRGRLQQRRAVQSVRIGVPE